MLLTVLIKQKEKDLRILPGDFIAKIGSTYDGLNGWWASMVPWPCHRKPDWPCVCWAEVQTVAARRESEERCACALRSPLVSATLNLRVKQCTVQRNLTARYNVDHLKGKETANGFRLNLSNRFQAVQLYICRPVLFLLHGKGVKSTDRSVKLAMFRTLHGWLLECGCKKSCCSKTN